MKRVALLVALCLITISTVLLPRSGEAAPIQGREKIMLKRVPLVADLALRMKGPRFLILSNGEGVRGPDYTPFRNHVNWHKDGQRAKLETFDTPPTRLGNGWAVHLNGKDERGVIIPRSSLGLNDKLTLVFLARLQYPPSRHIMGQYRTHDYARQQWLANISSDGFFTFSPVDARRAGPAGGEDIIAEMVPGGIPRNEWVLYIVTYQKDKVYEVYRNGVRSPSRVERTGDYQRMYAVQEPLYIGYEGDLSGEEAYTPMSLAMIALSGSVITEKDAQYITALTRQYFDVPLYVR